MRIWLDPDKVAALSQAGEVLAACGHSGGRCPQTAAGRLAKPYQRTNAWQLATPEQFAAIVLKSDARARHALRDVGRVEIGASDYGSTAFTDRGPGIPC